MAVPNVSELATTTLERRSKKIADNISKNNALLYMLQEKAEKPLDGGRLIYEAVSFAENAQVTSYSGSEQIPVGQNDTISSAEFPWKQYAAPVTINGLEELQNSGESRVFPLLATRVDVAEKSMKNRIAQDLYGDGTGNGGKNITGLDLAVAQVASTGTYGGIDRATYTFWRNQTLDPASTPDATTIYGFMLTLYLACCRESDRPNLGMAGSTVFKTFVTALQPLQRFTDAKLANAGFENVKFMSMPVVFDGGIGGFATATDLYMLNTNFLHWRPHADRNFVPGKKQSSWNQDAIVQMLLFAGNLTCSGAQFQGRGKFD